MSCRDTNNVSKPRKIGRFKTITIEEQTIDGHDYIIKGHGITHSGTCKKCKQERDSIVALLIEELNGIEP